MHSLVQHVAQLIAQIAQCTRIREQEILMYFQI